MKIVDSGLPKIKQDKLYVAFLNSDVSNILVVYDGCNKLMTLEN